MSGRKSRCREQPSQDCGVNSLLTSITQWKTDWLAMLGRSGQGRSPHWGPAVGCTAHKKKWLATGFVYKKCGMFAPKTDLGNPSCHHPSSSLCRQGFISVSPERWTWSRGKTLSWLANSCALPPPRKGRGNSLIVTLSLKLRKHAGKLGTCLRSQSSGGSRVLMAGLW